MNSKRVNRVLTQKFMDFLSSIENENIKMMIANNSIISGGSIMSLLKNEKVKDYDIYFKDKKTALAVAEYYVGIFNELNKDNTNLRTSLPEVYVTKNGEVSNKRDFDRIRIKVKSSGVVSSTTNASEYHYFEYTSDESADEYVSEMFRSKVDEADELDGGLTGLGVKTDKPYQPTFITDNAISLSGDIQLIIRFYGSDKEIHENFDYVHCTNWWDSKTRKLHLNKEALESILTNELKYIGSKYPIASVIRLRRFCRKGWWINAGQILKMCMQISELDLNDVKVLEDQLTGVDTVYFIEMLAVLKRASAEGKQIDQTYVMTLVDRIF